jgi:hypothetical protein
MKTKLFLLSTAVLMAGCANMGTTSEKMTQLTSNLKYSEQPSKEYIIKNASSLIKPALKDTDSLKNLTITQTDKCTLAEQNLSGNITPRYRYRYRYSYGQWCFTKQLIVMEGICQVKSFLCTQMNSDIHC